MIKVRDFVEEYCGMRARVIAIKQHSVDKYNVVFLCKETGYIYDWPDFTLRKVE
jgi:hypothetical protein